MKPKDLHHAFGRRSFLGACVSATGAWALGCAGDDTSLTPADATFAGVVPFDGEGPADFGVPIGAGLDGRLYDDLATLEPGTKITPTSRFYVRTRYPDRLDRTLPWRVRLGGLVEAPVDVAIEELVSLARPRGLHLLECSGNGQGAFFGMVSSATWDGVDLGALLDAKVRPRLDGARIRVTGFDEHSEPSARSVAGASWIFSREEIARTGAFLATAMNGAPLTPDHGAPVRLVVPGWYGCTCIKWVTDVELVADDVPATSQMREFASRTMQDGEPTLARDYRPAEIDQTAMPVRVEAWRRGEGRFFRVIGLAWGGARPTEALSLQMAPELPYERVRLFEPMTNATWAWWSHEFTPRRAGRHAMRLRVDDPTIRTRRLDSGFYLRTVIL